MSAWRAVCANKNREDIPAFLAGVLPVTSGRFLYLLLFTTDGKDDAVYRLPLQEIHRPG